MDLIDFYSFLFPVEVASVLAVAFVALVSVSNAVLQAYGRVYFPVVNMLIGGMMTAAFVKLPLSATEIK